MAKGTVKVGKLQMKAFAAKKPVTVGPQGKFMTAGDLVKAPSLGGGSLHSLSEKNQKKLTLERYRMEPNFKLGIIGMGSLTKSELLNHVKEDTEFGLEIVRAEMQYCTELMSAVTDKVIPKWKPLPKPKIEPIPKEWKWVPKKYWRWFRNCALFCENTTDSVTKYAAAYRKKYVHPTFKARGFCIIVLEGVDDVRANFAPKAKNKRVVYISGIGHGSPTTYTGHHGDPILRACNYDPAEVKDKVIHLLSCQTAKQLGPDVIKKGANAYAGYFENFTFVYDQPGTPVNEMELFWRCDSTFDRMMALGFNAEAAHKMTIARYNAAIAMVPGTAAATWLTHDRNVFRSPVISPIYGKKTARISPWFLFPIHPFMELEEELPEMARV